MNEVTLEHSSSYLCEKCGAELPTHLDYVKHRDDHKTGKIVEKEPEKEVVSEPIKAPTIDRKPIALKYLFEGQCTICGKEVTTLEMDVSKEHHVIAYCVPCKEQRADRKVVKL